MKIQWITCQFDLKTVAQKKKDKKITNNFMECKWDLNRHLPCNSIFFWNVFVCHTNFKFKSLFFLWFESITFLFLLHRIWILNYEYRIDSGAQNRRFRWCLWNIPFWSFVWLLFVVFMADSISWYIYWLYLWSKIF